MKPPTVYYGAKTRLGPWIATLLPPHRTYLEPYAGSLAVLFAKPPSPAEIANDLDGHVVNFFRVLRDQPEALIEACTLTPYARQEFVACADLDDLSLDPVERARRWWVRINQSVGVSRRGSGWASSSTSSGESKATKLVTKVERMRACAQRLRTVHLEHLPALAVLAKYATRPDVAVYCDPPYLASTRCKEHHQRPAGYAVESASEQDHRELAQVLHTSPASVLLSGYDSPLYRELYGDWWRLEKTVDVPAANGRGHPMAKATEVIWSNRPLLSQESLL